MKRRLKWLAIAIGGLIGGSIPLTIFYLAWSWAVDQVPHASEWAGLAKIGISLVMLVVGGWATLLCAFLLGTALAGLAVVALDP